MRACRAELSSTAIGSISPDVVRLASEGDAVRTIRTSAVAKRAVVPSAPAPCATRCRLFGLAVWDLLVRGLTV